MESRMAVRALSLSSWSDPTQVCGLGSGPHPEGAPPGHSLGGHLGRAERVQTGEPAGPLGRAEES